MEATPLIILVVLVLLILCVTKSNSPKLCRRGGDDPLKHGCMHQSKMRDYYPVEPMANKPVQQLTQPTDDEFSYQDYIVEAGLEKSVVESHNKFVDEVHHRTTGASAQSELSGDVDVNPWVGLRRVNYNAAFSQNDARTVSSEAPDQMYDPTSFRL